jgi:hypothetical protein
MRRADRTLVAAAQARAGWTIIREGLFVWKRPAAVLLRHPPLATEVRADRGGFVAWLRLRRGVPSLVGGDWTFLAGDSVGRGPVTFSSVAGALDQAEAWYDKTCRERGCAEHARERA